MLRILFSDFLGLVRVCGRAVALRWMGRVMLNLSTCMRQRNLQSADRAMGEGPFDCRLRAATAIMTGKQVISGIREIWVRDMYLGGGYLTIPPNGIVLDLGANMGNFTALALGSGPDVKVIAVEPNPDVLFSIERAAKVNHAEERLQICHSFIGGKTSVQERMQADNASAVPCISERDFVDHYHLTRIDLIKSDIEGGEFELFTRDSLLLAMAQQLTIELHDHAGNREGFIDILTGAGFETVVRQSDAGGCILNARRNRSI